LATARRAVRRLTPYSAGGPEELLRPFAGRWQIDVQPAQVPVWCALRERGSERRVIVAFSAPELARKLTAAEAADGT
jgi:hypothetical protein